MPRLPLPLAAAALSAAAALTLALPPVAGAEHEVYYRFVVLGFVTDARGQPRRDRPVEVVRDKTGFSYLGETDGEGLFVVIARLGDESLGETLTLRVDGRSTRLTARFDPANHADDRGTRVDLEDARFVERAAWFRTTLARFLASPAR